MQELWFVSLLTIAAAGVFTLLALSLRLRSRKLVKRPAATSLPPISIANARKVLDAARAAALDAEWDNRALVNPHSPGTRAYILWETESSAVLLGLEHEADAAKLRSRRSARNRVTGSRQQAA